MQTGLWDAMLLEILRDLIFRTFTNLPDCKSDFGAGRSKKHGRTQAEVLGGAGQRLEVALIFFDFLSDVSTSDFIIIFAAICTIARKLRATYPKEKQTPVFFWIIRW